MALGKSSSGGISGTPTAMSSTMLLGVTTAGFEPAPSSSVTNSEGGDDGNSGQRGANYFFGFLITFIVLLLVFVGFGVGSRRRFIARVRAQNAQIWAQLGLDRELEPPMFYEEQIVLPSGSEWKYLLPLSARLLRDEDEEVKRKQELDTVSQLSSLLPQQQPFSIFPSLNSLPLPSWMPGRHARYPPPVPEANSISDKSDLPETIQVAVVILMPSPPEDRLRAKRDIITEVQLPEYQIGLQTLPWPKN